MKIHSHTYPNGLQLVTVDTGSFSTLTAMVMVGAGSRYENKNNNGIAHFFEHMAFKGSKKFPSSYHISSAIEGVGGVFNAFTSKDHTGYWIKATNNHTSLMLDVLSDMILNPLLLSEEIEREKGVIIEEINMYEDMPARKVSDIFEEVLYKGSSLGMDIAGTKETVGSFTQDTFTSYIADLYHPNNAIVVLAGGLPSGGHIQDDVAERFGSWKKSSPNGYSVFTDSQKDKKIYVRTKKTEQVHMCVGYRAFSFADERRYVLQLLAAILGGGMSSRLFMQVRERRGLCYYISTGRELYADTGSIVSQAGIANDRNKVKEAISVIISEHEKLKTELVATEELTRAKELVKGRFLLSLEDSAHIATAFGTKLLLQKEILSVEKTLHYIESISAGEIQELAQELFIPNRLNIAIIGPLGLEDISS